LASRHLWISFSRFDACGLLPAILKRQAVRPGRPRRKITISQSFFSINLHLPLTGPSGGVFKPVLQKGNENSGRQQANLAIKVLLTLKQGSNSTFCLRNIDIICLRMTGKLDSRITPRLFLVLWFQSDLQ
jgi:hypothetical protein